MVQDIPRQRSLQKEKGGAAFFYHLLAQLLPLQRVHLLVLRTPLDFSYGCYVLYIQAVTNKLTGNENQILGVRAITPGTNTEIIHIK